VGGTDAAVVTDIYGLVVKRVCRAAEPPLAFAVEPYILVDLVGRIDGAQVGESAAEAVGSGAGFHGAPGCWDGALAGGNEGVKVVVVADEEAWGLPSDGSSWRGAVGTRGVVTGFVGHSKGQVDGQAGRFCGDADVGVSDWAVVALIAANAPGGLSENGAPVDAHGVEGVIERVVLGFGSVVGQTIPGQPQTDS